MKTKIVKSFEEGAESVGDILTGGKKARRVKVGLLTLGYFEYWRMFPEILPRVEANLKVVEDRMRASYDVVCSGMVDTLDTADAAGRLFREKNVDIVVAVCGTYVADFITLTAVDQVKDKPLVLFSLQGGDNVNTAGDYSCSLENSGIIGTSQLTGTLVKMKRKFKVVVGSKSDDRAYAEIGAYIDACQAIEDIRESNIGIIGHVFRGMYDIELSKTFLKSTFGVNVISIQSSHLLSTWQEVTESEARAEAAKLTARFTVKNVTEKDIESACKLAIAMDRIATKFHLDAMCFLDQHFIQRQVHASARIGASLLMEKTGMSVNCEGDLGGLVMMMLMRSLGKSAPLMGEWGEYDLATNSCLIIGHGIGTPDLAAGDEEVLLSRTPEEWGFEGGGLNYEIKVKPSPVTLGHILEGRDGYRMILSEGETIDFARMNYDELYAIVKVKKPVREFLEEVLNYGVSHHCIVGMSHMGKRLAIVCDMLGVESFIV